MSYTDREIRMAFFRGWKPRARRVIPKLQEKIPTDLKVQDLELGYYKKRISYSYCRRCSKVIEGWDKFCSCTGKSHPMQKSWIDINWNLLVNIFNIRKRHNLFQWGTIETI